MNYEQLRDRIESRCFRGGGGSAVVYRFDQGLLGEPGQVSVFCLAASLIWCRLRANNNDFPITTGREYPPQMVNPIVRRTEYYSRSFFDETPDNRAMVLRMINLCGLKRKDGPICVDDKTGSINKTICQKIERPGLYFITLERRGSGGHAVAVHNEGSHSRLFDSDFGQYRMPNGVFQDFLSDYFTMMKTWRDWRELVLQYVYRVGTENMR